MESAAGARVAEGVSAKSAILAILACLSFDNRPMLAWTVITRSPIVRERLILLTSVTILTLFIY